MALTPELVARCFRAEPEQPPRPDFTPESDDERMVRVDRLLDQCDGEAIWVFAYGSLLWKPVFVPDEVRRGVANGWHRAFTCGSRPFAAPPTVPAS